MLRPLTPPAGGPAGGRAGIDLKGATGGGSVPSAGTAAPEPSGTGNSAVREVEIHCNPDGCYSLWAAGGRCAVIADGHTRIIALLAQRVLGAYPSDVVVWRHLNDAVGSDETAAASNTLRQTLARLNTSVRKELGLPWEADDLFETVRGKGVRLSPSVRWSVSKELDRLLRASRCPRATRDPGVVAASLPGRGQRLPARSVRRKRGDMRDD